MSSESITRVKKTIKGESTDRIPRGELIVGDEVVQKYYQTDQVYFDQRYQFIKDMEMDLYSASPKYIHESHALDIDLNHLELDKWSDKGDVFTFVLIDGAFELGMRYFGFGEFMGMLHKSNEELQDFVKMVHQLNVKTIKRAADQGIHGIVYADDVAFQDGLFLRPSVFKDVFLGSMEEQVEEMYRQQVVPFFHSDGDYITIVPDIVDCGFQGVHCIDYNCGMNLEKIRKETTELCLWGHLDQKDIDGCEEPAACRNIKMEIEQTTGGKQIILGTNSGLFEGINVDRLKNLYEFIQ